MSERQKNGERVDSAGEHWVEQDTRRLAHPSSVPGSARRKRLIKQESKERNHEVARQAKGLKKRTAAYWSTPVRTNHGHPEIWLRGAQRLDRMVSDGSDGFNKGVCACRNRDSALQSAFSLKQWTVDA